MCFFFSNKPSCIRNKVKCGKINVVIEDSVQVNILFVKENHSAHAAGYINYNFFFKTRRLLLDLKKIKLRSIAVSYLCQAL